MPVTKKGPDLSKWFHLYVDRVDKTIAEVAEAVAELGEEVMVSMIETRGTGKTWKRAYGGRTGSYPGRVDTGEMRDDIRSFARWVSQTGAVAAAGWVYRFEDYYAAQDQGFTHNVTGEFIRGMNMLADAADIMQHEAVTLLGRKLRAL